MPRIAGNNAELYVCRSSSRTDERRITSSTGLEQRQQQPISGCLQPEGKSIPARVAKCNNEYPANGGALSRGAHGEQALRSTRIETLQSGPIRPPTAHRAARSPALRAGIRGTPVAIRYQQAQEGTTEGPSRTRRI